MTTLTRRSKGKREEVTGQELGRGRTEAWNSVTIAIAFIEGTSVSVMMTSIGRNRRKSRDVQTSIRGRIRERGSGREGQDLKEKGGQGITVHLSYRHYTQGFTYLSWKANVKEASSSTASTTTSLSMALMRDCTKDALFALYRNLSTNSWNKIH